MQLAGSVQFNMAAPISAKRLMMMCALVVVVAMQAAHPTEASSFVFYSGPGCSGNQAVLSACGCNTVPSNTHAGYTFTYAGQSTAAYNGAGCTGVASTRFQGRGTAQCTPVGWQSVFIQC